MKRLSALKTLHVLVAAISLGSAAFQSAQAQTETILHSFHSNGKDGTQPRAGLIRDTKEIFTAQPPLGALTTTAQCSS